MKSLALLLALYIVALSFTRCCDEHESQENIIVTLQGHDQHHQEEGLCSPFCQCNCCQSFIVLIQLKDVIAPPAYYQTQISAYKESFPPAIFVDHWRPPQLS